MFNIKRVTALGAAALLSVACSRQETPAQTPAQAPAAPSAAPITQAPEPAPAPAATPAGLQPLSAEQLVERRNDNASASCNIEAIGADTFTNEPLKVSRSISVRGWVLSEGSKKTGIPAAIRIQDETGATGWDANIDNWISRMDVNTAMSGVDSGNAGFVQTLDLAALAPGKYKLAVVYADVGGLFKCDNNRVIELE